MKGLEIKALVAFKNQKTDVVKEREETVWLALDHIKQIVPDCEHKDERSIFMTTLGPVIVFKPFEESLKCLKEAMLS